MNILLVEDEKITRVGIRKTIEKEESFTVVAECSNGKQALSQVDLHPDIDIILLDLNMPIMNGLEFLDHLDPAFKGHVIVLSSYDDLESIKTAMQKGAVDYFHKPTMSPQKIITMLKEAKKKLKKKPRLQTEEWIKQLIYAPDETLIEIEEHWIASKKNAKAVILCTVDGSNNPFISDYEIKKVLLKWCEVNGFKGEIISLKEGEFAVIEQLATHSLLNQFNHLQQICVGIRDYCNEVKKLSLSFGVSTSFHDPLALGKCVEQAEQALAKNFINGRGSIEFFLSEKPERKEPDPDTFEIWKAFEQHDAKGLEKALDEYFLKLKSIKDRDQIITLTIQLKTDLQKRMEKFSEHSKAFHISPKSVMHLPFFSDVKKDVLQDFNKMLKWLIEFENKQYTPMVRHILQYIDDHLDKDLSLDRLSSLVQTNPSYLSRVFKEQTGHKISDYITMLRIEKAQELLGEQRLRTKDVALAVGYLNERYFSQIFKKVTGMTPSDYKKRK